MDVKIKRLHSNAVIPRYGSEQAAGFDFYSIEELLIMPGETVLIGTGLAFELEVGTELQVRPRSGISVKTKIRVSNSPGTVDSDFRGEVKIILDNIGVFPYTVKVGDRVAQGVICPVYKAEFIIAEELDLTKRGINGMGSTGI